MKINPLLAIDFYKVGHKDQYPVGTTEIYSNFTARYVKSSHSLLGGFDNRIVVFGIQYLVMEYLCRTWQEGFFDRDKREVIDEYRAIVMDALSLTEFDTSHLEALHDLQYLPIKLKAIEEGSKVNIGIPILTIKNTHPDFFWLTNYLETAISAIIWKPITAATIANEFRMILNSYAALTCDDRSFVKFQAHDFSFRGMSGIEDASICGAAHLTSFCGTDCVSAIKLINDYYAPSDPNYLIGCSVPATEHSVMCFDGEDGEASLIKRLITEVYPEGIVSLVIDGYDFWNALTVTIASLKEEIISRPGKVVIRPDSGDPLLILCGDKLKALDTPEYKGAIACLDEIFGHTINSKGYKELPPCIGLIYGDSITAISASKILKNMKAQGYASNNVVFGLGSYTYQYVTRDTFGFAMKATSAVCNGVRRAIFKHPITDTSNKKSAKGLLHVLKDEDGSYHLTDNLSDSEYGEFGSLKTIFHNGVVYEDSLSTIEDIRRKIENP